MGCGGLHKGHSYQVLLADKNIVRMDVETASMRSEPICKRSILSCQN